VVVACDPDVLAGKVGAEREFEVALVGGSAPRGGEVDDGEGCRVDLDAGSGEFDVGPGHQILPVAWARQPSAFLRRWISSAVWRGERDSLIWMWVMPPFFAAAAAIRSSRPTASVTAAAVRRSSPIIS